MAQFGLLTLFADGGLMMYPLILCSLVAVGVIIAKAWTLYVAHKGSQQLLVDVEAAAREGRMDEAMQMAADTPGPTAAILMAGLRRIQGGKVRRGEVDQAVSTIGTIELGFLERGLVILATIANVAPLMGFLGTVAGMILAFDSIARAGDVDPSLVAGGIKVALLTTAAGLVIAVPVNIGYNFFVTRIDGLILDMEQGAQKVLSMAWDFEKEGRLTVVEEKRVVTPLPARRPKGAPQAAPAAPAPESPAGDA